MALKKLKQEHFNLLKHEGLACPPDITFKVGREYVIENPENPKEKIRARCTQNCPYALKKI